MTHNKDGKLNEAEMAQLNADASKALEARREARKAARGNNDMPPLPPRHRRKGMMNNLTRRNT